MSIGGAKRITITRSQAAAALAGGEVMLPVPYHRQEQDRWCWAACGQMLASFLGLGNVQQCQFAQDKFDGDCCRHPKSDACNRGCLPENSYGRFGIAIAPPARDTTQELLDFELGKRRPIEITYYWNGTGSHVALVTGRYANGTYEVHDPKFGPGPRRLSEIIDAYGQGWWHDSYANLRRL